MPAFQQSVRVNAARYVSGIVTTVSKVTVTFGSVFNIPSIAFGGVMP